MKTKDRIIKLEEEIDNHYNEIRRLQKRCKHTKATKIAKTSVGHYDPHNDMYWYDYDCPNCLKRWTEEIVK